MAYSAKLEANVNEKAKVSTELDPRVLAQVSDALQEAREFQKYVIAGYNSCAITQQQYARFGSRLQALDNIAREITAVTSRASSSPEEARNVTDLVRQYCELARQLGSQ